MSQCNVWRGVNWGHYLVYCFVVTVMKIIHYSPFLSCKTPFSLLAGMMRQCHQTSVRGHSVWDQHFYCFLVLSHVSALILMLKTPSTNTISSFWFWAQSRKNKKRNWSRPETPKHEDNTGSTRQQQNNGKNVDFCLEEWDNLRWCIWSVLHIWVSQSTSRIMVIHCNCIMILPLCCSHVIISVINIYLRNAYVHHIISSGIKSAKHEVWFIRRMIEFDF